MLSKRHAILILCILIATMGTGTAFQAAWQAPTGQPNMITGDGQNILVATPTAVKEVGPSGTEIWSQDIAVSGNGSAIKAGKYIFVGTGNDVKALNKNDGSTKWTSITPLGAGQAAKWIFTKGNYVLVSNNDKAVVLDRETGVNATPISDAPTLSEPTVFGGYYLASTNTGVQAYKGFMLPDLRVKSIDKQSDKTVATLENIGLTDATNVLVKFVVRKTDGTYRTIHINGGTVAAGNTKEVTITGGFSKGYAIVDPYYRTGELNEGNNQRYFN